MHLPLFSGPLRIRTIKLIRDIWQWEWHALIVWGAVAEDEPVRGLDSPRGHSHQAHLLTGSVPNL
jgi:hypothetical protein